MCSRIVIAVERADRADITALLAEGDDFYAGLYPPLSNHRLNLTELLGPEVVFCAARQNGHLLGVGALVRRGLDWAEIKSMYVSKEARGQGIGGRVLDFLEQQAAASGLRVLRLETGNKQPEALSLYRGAGFVEVPPFAGYEPDPNSLFLEKRL
jgi:putative acetyltransferase